jgi:hypothetical protein
MQYCTLTRPDISSTVNQLCQFLHSLTTTHWTVAKRVLRYLKSSINHGLYFGKGPLRLNAYKDSNWAGNPDDRRSTTRYALFLGPCLVSWCAKKPLVISKLAQKLNIGPLHLLLLSYASCACFKSLISNSIVLLHYGVIILVPWP